MVRMHLIPRYFWRLRLMVVIFPLGCDRQPVSIFMSGAR
jgi:hypothetical protein